MQLKRVKLKEAVNLALKVLSRRACLTSLAKQKQTMCGKQYSQWYDEIAETYVMLFAGARI